MLNTKSHTLLLILGLSLTVNTGCGNNDTIDTPPGSDASMDLGGDGSTDLSGLCARDERVVDAKCQACPDGSTNEPGDDSSGADTQCEATLCAQHERVTGNLCQACPDGSTNEAGDDSSAADTLCDPTLCGANQSVVDNQCQACAADTVNEAGDDATGADTLCEDPCAAVLGVACEDVEQAYIKASNTGIRDDFSRSVSLSGDTLVVGARSEDSDATGVDGDQSNDDAPDSGAVYVFTRANGVWSQQAYIKASNAARGDGFGESVVLSGDTLIVGAVGEDSDATGVDGDQNNDNAPDSGAVYVFTRTDTTWSQQAYLKASNSERGDEFGKSLTLDTDTLVVGARSEDSDATGVDGDQTSNDAPDSGAVYVFARTNDSWSQQAYLKASNADARDDFGKSVALSGNTLAVGALAEASDATGIDGDQTNDTTPRSGAVYVFTRTDATWGQQAYLKASNAGTRDDFSWSIALSGDTLAVGALGEDSGATGVDGDQSNDNAPNSGAVYVFTRTDATWSQQAYLKASNAGQNDLFGTSVALSGDALVVGAPGEGSSATGINGSQTNDNRPNSGAAYMFARTNGVWNQQAYIKASNTGIRDEFGESVTLSDNTLVVGSLAEASDATGIDGDQTNGNAPSSGAAYVYKIAP